MSDTSYVRRGRVQIVRYVLRHGRVQGAVTADLTSDPNLAERAGLPLPRGIVASSALPATQAPLSKNPCLGKSDPGFSTGLSASFFSVPYPKDANSSDAFPVSFTGLPSFKR
jgi:hypothetical protein